MKNNRQNKSYIDYFVLTLLFIILCYFCINFVHKMVIGGGVEEEHNYNEEVYNIYEIVGYNNENKAEFFKDNIAEIYRDRIINYKKKEVFLDIFKKFLNARDEKIIHETIKENIDTFDKYNRDSENAYVSYEIFYHKTIYVHKKRSQLFFVIKNDKLMNVINYMIFLVSPYSVPIDKIDLREIDLETLFKNKLNEYKKFIDNKIQELQKGFENYIIDNHFNNKFRVKKYKKLDFVMQNIEGIKRHFFQDENGQLKVLGDNQILYSLRPDQEKAYNLYMEQGENETIYNEEGYYHKVYRIPM